MAEPVDSSYEISAGLCWCLTDRVNK